MSVDGRDSTDLLPAAPGSVTPTHLGVVPAARVEGQTASNGTATLTFQTEVYDTDGNRGLFIRTGSESLSIIEGDLEKTTHGVGLQTSVVVPLDAGQGVTARAFESSSSTSITTDAAAPRSTFLELLWVGPSPDETAATTADIGPSTSPTSAPGSHGRVTR